MKKILLIICSLSSIQLFAGPGAGTVGGGGIGDRPAINIYQQEISGIKEGIVDIRRDEGNVTNRLFLSSNEQDSYFRVMKKEEIDSSGLLRAARQMEKIPNEIQFFLNEENDLEDREIRVLTNFSDIESIKLKDGRVIQFSDRRLKEKLEFYPR